MLLSIVIPVYNGEQFIDRCIDSILMQGVDAQQYEILAVDDGSTDDTLRVLQDYASRYSNIRAITIPHQGQSVARNVALDVARGEWIMFVDADDALYPDKLTGLLETVQSHPDANMVAYRMSHNANPAQVQHAAKTYTDGFSYINSTGFSNGPWWYIVRRAELERIGLRFVPGMYGEDAMFTMHLLLNISNIVDTKIEVYHYIGHPDSTLQSRDPEHQSRMIDSYEYVADYINDLIEQHKEQMSEICLRRCTERRDSFLYCMLGRIVKAKMPLKEVSVILNRLKQKGRYPFQRMSMDYSGLKFGVLHHILNRPWLFKTACAVLNIIYKR